jgi:phosphate uptake regulator
MSLVLNLPPDLENELSAEADRLRLSLPEYALRLLAGQRPAGMPRNGTELVAYWEREGLLGTRPEIADAAAHARAIRQQAEKREHR